jgi:hypothetical protein
VRKDNTFFLCRNTLFNYGLGPCWPGLSGILCIMSCR